MSMTKERLRWIIVVVVFVAVSSVCALAGALPNYTDGGTVSSWHRHGKSTYDASLKQVWPDRSSHYVKYRFTSRTRYYWSKTNRYGEYSGAKRVSRSVFWRRIRKRSGANPRSVAVKAKRSGGRWVVSRAWGNFPAM